MSRIGKQPISIPQGVTVSVEKDMVTVQGPKGTLAQRIEPFVSVSAKDGVVEVRVERPEDSMQCARWGLYQRLVQNMVIGVTEGYEKRLEIKGVGYGFSIEGKEVVVKAGFSHLVRFPLPEGVSASQEKNVLILSGIDKQLVGNTAAQIRKIRPPEPYKGKGIRYTDEVVRRKAGKQAK